MSLLLAAIGDTDLEVPTRAVNTTSQAIVTFGAYAVVVAVGAWALRMSRERRSPTPLLVVLTAGVGTINEASWNSLYHLYWYRPGQWNLWSSFGIGQPCWIIAIYIVIYAGPALLLWRRLESGTFSRQSAWTLCAGASAAIAVLEVTVIESGVYAYYGDLPFAVDGKYPLYAAVMEGAFITVFAVVVARLGPVLRGWGSLLLVPVFSLLFCGVFFGGGMPALVMLNGHGVATGWEYVGVVAALGLTLTMVWLVAHLLPGPTSSTGQLEVHVGRWTLSATHADLTEVNPPLHAALT